MYVRGSDQSQVQKWVDTVHGLRYKDYNLVSPVSAVPGWENQQDVIKIGALEEVGTVKEMGARMEADRLQKWWRTAMGFVHE